MLTARIWEILDIYMQKNHCISITTGSTKWHKCQLRVTTLYSIGWVNFYIFLHIYVLSDLDLLISKLLRRSHVYTSINCSIKYEFFDGVTTESERKVCNSQTNISRVTHFHWWNVFANRSRLGRRSFWSHIHSTTLTFHLQSSNLLSQLLVSRLRVVSPTNLKFFYSFPIFSELKARDRRT